MDTASFTGLPREIFDAPPEEVKKKKKGKHNSACLKDKKSQISYNELDVI